MNNKIIIAATCFFILISFTYLSIVENKQSDINKKNLWMIYFQNPKDNSLDFTIENHSSHKTFHWQVLSDKSIVKESDENIQLGEKKNISVMAPSVDTNGKRFTISVTTNKEQKEIYKIY